MNKIQWHAVSKGAQVRSKPEATAMSLKCLLPGTWMGVTKVEGDWAYIISKEAIGWVMSSEIGRFEDKSLHIVYATESSQNLAYIGAIKKAS